MVCEIGVNIIACGPPAGVYKRRMQDCPECNRRHRFVVRWDGAWYGTTLYGSCGDSWQDGYLGYRPFERGWRQKAQARFRAMWKNAAPADLYERYVLADCAFGIGDDGEWEKAAAERAAAHDAILAARGHQ